MSAAFWTRAGALLMFLSVSLGAFAAHALKGRLDSGALAVFETGARYQAYHALGLFVVAWILSRGPSRMVSSAGFCFLGGIALFSGSLYLLGLTGWRKFGMITPVGGVLFLAGWGLLALAGLP